MGSVTSLTLSLPKHAEALEETSEVDVLVILNRACGIVVISHSGPQGAVQTCMTPLGEGEAGGASLLF